jgi:RNA polymerase sigma factor (sigma-70 family)
MSGAVPSNSEQDERRTSRALASYRTFLLAVAKKQMGNSLLAGETASDFVQKALLAAMLADGKGQGPGPTEQELRGWLVMILKNKIIEARRPRGRVTRELMPDNIADEGTSPSEGAIRNEERNRLDKALKTLSPEDQQLVVWSIKENLSRKEIGERLGMSSSYVSRICMRAQNRFQRAYRALGKEFVEESR